MDQAPARLSAVFTDLVDDIREELNELKQSYHSVLKKYESLETRHEQSELELSEHKENFEQLSASLADARQENKVMKKRIDALQTAHSEIMGEAQPRERPRTSVFNAPAARRQPTIAAARTVAESPEATEFSSARSFNREASAVSSTTFCNSEQSRQRRLTRHNMFNHTAADTTMGDSSPNQPPSSNLEDSQMVAPLPKSKKRKMLMQSGDRSSPERRSHTASSETINGGANSVEDTEIIVVATKPAGSQSTTMSAYGHLADEVLGNFEVDTFTSTATLPQSTGANAVADGNMEVMEQSMPRTGSTGVDDGETMVFARDNGRLRSRPVPMRRAMGEIDWRELSDV